jgi:glycosyltransferase involved in cell wall biosynthesis
MPGTEHTPLLSVIMPVHNAAAYLQQAVDSVLQQTFADFELILLNDGSGDDSANILASVHDPRVRIISNEKNIGLTATLNKGLGLCRGKFIARMDADDRCLPGRFAKQISYLEAHPAVAVLACRAQLINADGEITGEWNDDALHTAEHAIRRFMPYTNCLVHPSVIMRAEIVKKYGYREYQKGAEDWDLWLRLLADGHKIHKLDEVLLQYRVHLQSTMAAEKETTVQQRLIKVKCRWLAHRFPRIDGFYLTMAWSWLRSMASHLKFNLLPQWLRNVKRLLTISPFTAFSQLRRLGKTLDNHQGRVFLFFPYTHVGGAEQVHADIAAALRDHRPLVFFTAFSQNKKFLPRFKETATALNIPEALNYPFTAKKAMQLIKAHIEGQDRPLALGSNSGYFYELAARLSPKVKLADLIHAFKYQPEGNEAQKKYLAVSAKFSHRIFVSGAAMNEFREFCFRNNCPKNYLTKLKLIYNQTALPPARARGYGLPLKVLFAGRASEEKRLWLFEKIATALNAREAGKFRFTVAGARGSTHGITYLGELHDAEKMSAEYDAADFIVLTSYREGLPLVIMEAMAHGVIPLATPVGDIPNHISGGRGFVCSSTDENIVVNEISRALADYAGNTSKLSGMAADCREYAASTFGRQRFVNEYRALVDN